MEKRNLLVLCKTNAARSIMVETCVNAAGQGWQAFSAGTHPASKLNTYTALALRERGLVLDPDRRPKSYAEFMRADAPRFDVVLTVCEDIAWEKLPAWAGAPRLLHWALPDPTAADCTPSERADMFRAVLDLVEKRVDDFLGEERRVRHGEVANDNRSGTLRQFGT